ncbi:hypothetical protein ACFOD4_00480 [Pseudoroseomonas globiformis]|uniref:Uncharacterized protein n=1 Tax=Teichococcus globiformis TaxID=2307229 RepID=A0ABV7FW03_9PROT
MKDWEAQLQDFRLKTPTVQAIQYAPGLEDGWAVTDAEALIVHFFHADRNRAESWAQEHSHNLDQVLPAMFGRGWERDILSIRDGDWIVKHPDGKLERLSELTFKRLYEPVPRAIASR